ncbi:hypothetical protein PAMP_024633 [Pampus punctatissimus]
MASSLICTETQSRVSSVLNRDVKQYGKKYMFDCNEETCWNSDQGECQWVSLEFPHSVRVSELKIQFQGGFSSKTCRLEGYCKNGDFTVISNFYPEDNNSLQISFILTMQRLDDYRVMLKNAVLFFLAIIIFLVDIAGVGTLTAQTSGFYIIVIVTVNSCVLYLMQYVQGVRIQVKIN